MANEARITSSLQINVGTNVNYNSLPRQFNANIAGTTPKGPVPGAIEATLAGTNIDFSELTEPTFCRIMNQDSNNFVEVGIWDVDNSTFFPLFDVWAGESYVIRLSAALELEFGTGTGTTGPSNTKLRIKADTAACQVLVEAFEK